MLSALKPQLDGAFNREANQLWHLDIRAAFADLHATRASQGFRTDVAIEGGAVCRASYL